MKKSVLTVVLVALVSVFVSSVNAQVLPEFLYNSYEENGKLLTKQVCKFDPSVSQHKRHLLYEYGYAETGALISCKAFRWNAETSSWENAYIKTYEFDTLSSTVTVNYAVWNKKDKSFDEPCQKAVYQVFGDNHLASYYQYEKETESNDWEIKTHFSMNNYFVSQLAK